MHRPALVPNLCILLILLLFGGGCERIVPHGHPEMAAAQRWVDGACELGAAFHDRLQAGTVDFTLSGSRFWAQFAGDVTPRELAPCDQCCSTVEFEGRSIKVGFYGPDEGALELMSRGETEALEYLGCSLQATAGTCKLCTRGVAVIDSGGNGDFRFWDELVQSGAKSKRVRVGPDCPDERFRHLTR